MLDSRGFDLWSGNYDQDILVMQEQGYPFEGYYNTLGTIQQEVRNYGSRSVLDIGIGTGLLTQELYRAGLSITGLDFSSEMIALAREKMPGASFVQADFSEGLPEEITGRQFDCVVSSYAIHHLTDKEKIPFLQKLTRLVTEGGVILIGDVAFLSRIQLDQVKQVAEGWDHDEFYMAAEEIIAGLEKAGVQPEFIPTSSCSGILKIIC